MLSHLTRTQAWLVILAIMSLFCANMLIRPAAVNVPQAETTYRDYDLYREVTKRVASGENYYHATTDIQRHHNYPTQPFITVRLPTMAWVSAAIGWPAVQILLMALLIAGMLTWYVALKAFSSGLEAAAAAMALLTGGAIITQNGLLPFHELWAGLILCPALALLGNSKWWLAVLCGAAALAVRELALPFILLALAFAVLQNRRKEALCWASISITFVIALAFHAQAVQAQIQAGDLTSPGWLGFRGPSAFMQDIAFYTVFSGVHAKWAYILLCLPLLGWLAIPSSRQTHFALVWFLACIIIQATIARQQNSYWTAILLPTWFIGYAYVPRALYQLYKGLLRAPAS